MGPKQLMSVLTSCAMSVVAEEVLDVAFYFTLSTLPLGVTVAAINLACCFLCKTQKPATREVMVGTDEDCGNGTHRSEDMWAPCTPPPVEGSAGRLRRTSQATADAREIITTATGKCWHKSESCYHVKNLNKQTIKRFRPCRDCTGSF